MEHFPQLLMTRGYMKRLLFGAVLFGVSFCNEHDKCVRTNRRETHILTIEHVERQHNWEFQQRWEWDIVANQPHNDNSGFQSATMRKFGDFWSANMGRGNGNGFYHETSSSTNSVNTVSNHWSVTEQNLQRSYATNGMVGQWQFHRQPAWISETCYS